MADKTYSANANKNFGSRPRPAGHVDASAGIGTAPDRMTGILGKPLAKNGASTMTAKASDNSGPPSMTYDLNMKNAAAQRRGTGR